jgi:CRISPR system Cascade subunit CasD
MTTLLLRLAGPMQSWGTTSRFNERDSGPEPSKSGVIGLLAAALGIDRSDGLGLEPLSCLPMAVRHDRPGVPKIDYQTAGCAREDTIIKADGSQSKDGGVISWRHHLADAIFLVGLEGETDLLQRLHKALQQPVWPLSLGRKSYVPSEPISLPDAWHPIQDAPLRTVMERQPWLGSRRGPEVLPERLLLSLESESGTGSMRMDLPLSSFAERRFGARFVRSEWIPFPGVMPHVSA